MYRLTVNGQDELFFDYQSAIEAYIERGGVLVTVNAIEEVQ
jgi:hypothetical protein